MGSLGILNTTGSSAIKYFQAVEDPQKMNFFTAEASVYGPLLEIQALFLTAVPNNSLA